jgi:hypothetical protein
MDDERSAEQPDDEDEWSIEGFAEELGISPQQCLEIKRTAEELGISLQQCLEIIRTDRNSPEWQAVRRSIARWNPKIKAGRAFLSSFDPAAEASRLELLQLQALLLEAEEYHLEYAEHVKNLLKLSCRGKRAKGTH